MPADFPIVPALRDAATASAPGTTAVRALDDVSLSVARGEIFGVVGQSGAGKSTLIRTVNSLERPDSGSVSVDGREMTTLAGAELREARHNIGMIFQHFGPAERRGDICAGS